MCCQGYWLRLALMKSVSKKDGSIIYSDRTWCLSRKFLEKIMIPVSLSLQKSIRHREHVIKTAFDHWNCKIWMYMLRVYFLENQVEDLYGLGNQRTLGVSPFWVFDEHINRHAEPNRIDGHLGCWSRVNSWIRWWMRLRMLQWKPKCGSSTTNNVSRWGAIFGSIKISDTGLCCSRRGGDDIICVTKKSKTRYTSG